MIFFVRSGTCYSDEGHQYMTQHILKGKKIFLNAKNYFKCKKIILKG